MKKRILIIDDDEHVRRMMRLTLEAAGYELGEAANGAQGLEAFGDGSSWNAVLLDHRMPGIDGLETLRLIKERRPYARVIVSTAYASIDLAVDAMKLGATDLLRKPMTPEILRHTVAACLAKELPVSRGGALRRDDSGEPSIEIITMNGFTISESDGARPEPDERRFTVKSPNGHEYEVLVQIDEEAIGYVERMTRKELPAENSFWTSQAQRLLSDYLWKTGQVPIRRKLILQNIDRDELPIAARW